ncbi:MAG: 23S rRNA (pseudouridine(1915)-N(3))-methyltransferase RlmH [Desulfobacca sp.]|nr:23S rRNA (pseudouridine(1915)-N(3))-methyltransferase RlmH [Desulfobacca sp.]
MLNIVILMVGKTRTGFIQEGLAFYQKRLRPYLKLSLITVREEKPYVSLSADHLRAREGARLLAKIPRPARTITLETAGQLMTSEALAQWLTNREQESAAPLVFVVGGHLGLAPAVVTAADYHLSLSRLTFTHELSRLILLEQIYRAMTIRAGHPYHL